ncbi:MAG: alpha-galactosidase [Faecalicatena sp.]|uniref:glycoside hydrolase family 36 protein n=1 Tax=Faecalicatena sp. TaxID=2005360 RepID=UPI00258E564D|nr:glycoside hydrolase family 36 protein [Faecalicatena sp.]MCI6466444.1 alpha-galactosidase [Faecalicatena sp.]MDY5618406.1 glycoside hydrolase family 36 protein [Lachnospiraceae bacterium]
MENRKYQFLIEEKPEGLHISSQITEEGELVIIRLHVESKEEQIFLPTVCSVVVPACEIHEIWNPKIHLIKALNLDWFQYLKKTNGFTGAPVQCLIGIGNQNCAALGISDTLNTFEFQAVPVEETGEYAFCICMFMEEHIPKKTYDVELRLDLRRLPYYRVLDEMAAWWENEKRNHPAAVPAEAKEPMYSTWYSFHQMVEEKELLKQCRLSRELGCRSILLDDGWQTEDGNRGYAYCGDWQNATSKIPDMAAFVKKVHDLDMKVIPWYSLPFIGEKSENFSNFRDMLIDPDAKRQWHVLDPRYPKVREFIISLFEQALDEWDVDGFKMDFIDEFVVTPFGGKEADPRRDFESFHEAADCMMKECTSRLKAKKPDILLEFRQTYNGPMMRSYGNIFRAVDCPFDAVENRVRVTDVRLLCRNSAVHSDMIMWHPKDTVESAALQIINILFSVPQISMRLDELSKEHQEMLAFYMGIWKKYRDPLINGTFEPLNPISRYNVIKGACNGQLACVWHENAVVMLEQIYEKMLFVNGTAIGKLYLDCKESAGRYEIRCYDCTGHLLKKEQATVEAGFKQYEVPPSGVLEFCRI